MSRRSRQKPFLDQLFDRIPWRWVWVMVPANAIGALCGAATYFGLSRLSSRPWIYGVAGLVGTIAQGSLIGALANWSVEEARESERLRGELRRETDQA